VRLFADASLRLDKERVVPRLPETPVFRNSPPGPFYALQPLGFFPPCMWAVFFPISPLPTVGCFLPSGKRLLFAIFGALPPQNRIPRAFFFALFSPACPTFSAWKSQEAECPLPSAFRFPIPHLFFFFSRCLATTRGMYTDC